MGDRLRLVTRTGDGRPPVCVRDLADGVNFYPSRGTFKVTPPKGNPIMANPGGRWGGQRPVGETHDNGAVAFRLLVKGLTADAALAAAESALDSADAIFSGVYLEWRPEGASFSTYYQLRGPADWDPDYRWVQFKDAKSLEIGFTFPVGPLAYGDEMDVWDEFTPRGSLLYTNTVRNPSFEVNANNWTYYVSGGAGAIVRDTGDHIGTGVASLMFSGTTIPASGTMEVLMDGAQAMANGVRCVPGDVVYLAFALKLVGFPATPQSFKLRARVNDQASGGYITEVDLQTQANPVSGQWYTLAGWFTATQSCFVTPEAVLIANGSTGGSYSFRVDHAMAVKVPNISTTPPYFDGDADKSIWTGTPHDSPSQLYSASPLDDYTVDTGTWIASNDALKIVTPGSITRVRHTGRGYKPEDVWVTLRYTTGAVVASQYAQIHLRALSSVDFITCMVTNGTIAIARVDNETATTLTSSAGPTVLANGTYWIRAKAEGNFITVEHWLTEPTPGGTPTTTLTAGIASGGAARFGKGMGGGTWGFGLSGASVTDWTVDEVRAEPYSYSAVNLPDIIDLPAIPGSERAIADVVFERSGQSLGNFQGWWGGVGWYSRPAQHNMMANGDFEQNTFGWSVAATVLSAAASSITRVTTAARYGKACGEVSAPATTNSGPNFRVFRRFREGVTYTVQAWVRSAAQTTAIKVGVGVSGDSAFGPNVTLSPTWQLTSVQWTPTADRDEAYVVFPIQAATATTYQIDGVMVVEGAAVTTTDRAHIEGRGAIPPLGVIQAEAVSAAATPSVLADANASNGYVMRHTIAGAGAINLSLLEWMIAPQLVMPDEFDEDLTIEFWMRIVFPLGGVVSALNLVLQAIPVAAGESAGTPTVLTAAGYRYTNEYGSAGKQVAQPSSGGSQLQCRLGTITFPAEQLRRGVTRWRLVLAYSGTAAAPGNMDFDYLFAMPASARACGVTGKATNQAIAPSMFLTTASSTSERKRIRCDLAGRSQGLLSDPEIPSPGLGGSIIELPPGDAQIAANVCGYVPDDPLPLSGATDGVTATKQVNMHVAVTPRYQLVRGS